MKGGQVVTVRGKGFDACGGSAVGCRFDSAESPSATLDVATNTIKCVTPKSPAGASLVPVYISLNKVAYVQGPSLFYYHDTPQVLSLDPPRGPVEGNTLVTLIGKNFYDSDGLKCMFKLKNVAMDSAVQYISDEKIVCRSPKTTATGKVEVAVTLNGVQTGDSVSVDKTTFEYYAQPILNSIAPKLSTLTGGVQVTIKGSNFPDPANVPSGLRCKFKDTVSAQVLAAIYR